SYEFHAVAFKKLRELDFDVFGPLVVRCNARTNQPVGGWRLVKYRDPSIRQTTFDCLGAVASSRSGAYDRHVRSAFGSSGFYRIPLHRYQLQPSKRPTPGNRSIPRKTQPPATAGFSSISRRFGSSLNNAGMATVNSARATQAPRQTCTPLPKAKCAPSSVRVKSNRSGSLQ